MPIACSLVTVGKSSKKSSMEMPCSRWSNNVSKGTRVPLKTGCPPSVSGWMLINQTIRENGESIDFKFVPRNLIIGPNHSFIIGGINGGLYLIDPVNGRIICYDDVAEKNIGKIYINNLWTRTNVFAYRYYPLRYFFLSPAVNLFFNSLLCVNPLDFGGWGDKISVVLQRYI